MKKKELGQFYTTTNPFGLNPFVEWFDSIKSNKLKFIEPFAGTKNLVKMIDPELSFFWKYYDLDPKSKDIIQNDSIENFPQGFDVCITNPPYLAKNSAKRKKINFPNSKYDDLYKIALEQCIKNCRYTVAIIPESFITANIFHSSLVKVISLNFKMFEDTECPVCLAIFDNKKNGNDFKVYLGNDFIGNYQNIKKYNLKRNYLLKLYNFYDPNGLIALFGVDNTKNESIHFDIGNKINPSLIKKTSRNNTRISFSKEVEQKIIDFGINTIIDQLNQEIKKYRKNTKDVFMTSFKGLRKDHKYRRRLDFQSALCIIEKVLKNNNII